MLSRHNILLHNATFVPSCCQIGSTCSYTACDTLHYQCLSTSTITGVPTTVAACCPRSCPSTSAYKCPDPSGGCCSFDSSCEGNACVSTVSTSKAVASEIPVGCTATTQIACPSSLGGGCCVNTESCTVVSNSNYCVAITGVATRTGSNGAVATLSPSTASNGLSTGAKAGIGAGIAVLALVLITALLWFYLIYRRNSTPSQPTPSQPTESERPIPPARQGTDYFGPIATAGPFTEDHATPPLGRPSNMSGVPISPHSPGDIAVPVAIDSKCHSNSTTPGQRKGEGTAVEMAELP